MEDSIKNLFDEIEETQYACFVGHCAVYINMDPSYDIFPDMLLKTYGLTPEESDSAEIAFHLYYIAKDKEQGYEFDRIIRSKVASEFGDNYDGQNKVRVVTYDLSLEYSVVAGFFDYNSQDVLQDNFSIKQKLLELPVEKAFAKRWYAYDSDIMQKMDSVGMYPQKDRFMDNMIEDYIKAYKLGYLKESTLTESDDTINADDYKIYVTHVSIGPTKQIFNYASWYSFFSPTKEQAAKDLLKIYANVQKHNKNKKTDRQCKVYKSKDKGVIYSVAAKDYNFDDQLLFNPDFDIVKVAYKAETEANIPALNPYLPILKYDFYYTPEEFANNYFTDLVEYMKDHPNLEECCCAAGIGGGVTTASFAPAVTHTQYPRPGSKKKKKSKKEDNETIDDIYSYYGCVVRLSLLFPGSDTKIRKYYVVLGKDLGQIDEFNQKINQNIKQISNDSCILSTTLTGMLYSTEIKDFDFEGQKLLDSSLYVDDPKKFISSEKQLDQEEVQIRDIMGRSYDNLADFTNDLFTKLTEDTTSDLTIEDIYGFYSTVVTISFDAGSSKYMYFLHKMGTNFMVLIGKTPEQLKEFIEKVRNNISFIDRAKLLETEKVFHLYNTEIKDFNFEGQKLLDSSLFNSDPNKMKKNAKPLLDDQIRIKKIVIDSADNLVDFTDNLFSQMTEDTDDVYWPVRNDETDAFEKSIIDTRQAKKDKIIARKTKAIEKRNKNVNDWLLRVGDNMDLVKMSNMLDKYNKGTNKMVAELERIKKLPLTSPEFL